MKHLFKKAILVLGLLIFTYTCQEPSISEEFPVTENIDASYRIISLNEAPEVKTIIENIQPQIEEANGLYRQTSTIYGVAKVDIDEIIAITKQGVTNYTFGIDTDFKHSGYIENLQLIAVEEGYIAYIMRYEPEEGWEDDDFNKTPKGDLVLDVKNFNGHKTKYTLEGEIIWTTDPTYDLPAFRTLCGWVTSKHCRNNGSGGYSNESHVAGPNCTGYGGIFNYVTEWVCVEANYHEITEDDSPGGGGTGSPDGGNNTNNPPEEDDCDEVEGSLIINLEEVIAGISRRCSPNPNTGVTFPKIENLKNQIEECLGEDYDAAWFDNASFSEIDSIASYLDENCSGGGRSFYRTCY
ncbi:hypothetical protein [Psychroserpens sp.]